MGKDRVETAAALLVELQAAISDAHKVLRDLTTTHKEIKALYDSLPEQVRENTSDYIRQELDNFGSQIGRAIDEASERVNTRFDLLASILMGEDRRSKRMGKASLMDLAKVSQDADQVSEILRNALHSR